VAELCGLGVVITKGKVHSTVLAHLPHSGAEDSVSKESQPCIVQLITKLAWLIEDGSLVRFDLKPQVPNGECRETQDRIICECNQLNSSVNWYLHQDLLALKLTGRRRKNKKRRKKRRNLFFLPN